jgi:hypothetical protein
MQPAARSQAVASLTIPSRSGPPARYRDCPARDVKAGHVRSATGGEVLGALAVAVHGQVPGGELQTMSYAYPTFHRAIEAALAGLAPA